MTKWCLFIVWNDHNACLTQCSSGLLSYLFNRKDRCSEDQSCLSPCQETNYWTLSRQVCKEEKPEEPIVFLHGVGIGLVGLPMSMEPTFKGHRGDL